MPEDQTELNEAGVEAGVYVHEESIGFLLRQVVQRHNAIYHAHMSQVVTTTQWAAMSRLFDHGACSQNQLGRFTAMDAPTIKGVVERLRKRGLVSTAKDPEHKRRNVLTLTDEGRQLFTAHIGDANVVNDETLEPLTPAEQQQLMSLLKKMR